MAARICSIVENGAPCSNPHYCRTWCVKHYLRWRKHGDPLDHGAFIRGDDRARVCSKVDKSDGCWLWTGTVLGNGYGQISLAGRTRVGAHRYSYELAGGTLVEGIVIDHLCRVRHCVNPAHLEQVTQRENVIRGVRDRRDAA